MTRNELTGALSTAVSMGAEFAEIFLEDSLTCGLAMIGGVMENASTGRIYGAGIRVAKGGRVVFVSTTDVTEQGLISAAKSAATALGASGEQTTVYLTERIPTNIHPIMITPGSVELQKKAERVRFAHDIAKEVDPKISTASAQMADKDQRVTIANSEGLFIEDRRIRSRFLVAAVASDGTQNQTSSWSAGALKGYEFIEGLDIERGAKEAAKGALTMLGAEPCKAGRMPVAIENGFGGVIFHEACGHSLEAEQIAKGGSEFCGKLGERVATDKVTAIDDGTIPGAWGSINIDDEGSPGQRNILIEKGILKGYMIDRINGERMGEKPTGNSRRQSYNYAPTSRMTNTYIAPGEDSDEAIIKAIGEGLYAKKIGGGSVNPTTGEFNFAVLEGYMVHGGEISEPVRGASLIGKGSEIIKKIDMVGKNLDHGEGMCGSVSGSVPVCTGQPLILVSDITVGGR